MPLIQNVDFWIYEINYDNETIDKLIDNSDISTLHTANNIKYHNSLENAEQYFSSLNNKPKLLIVCHTSKLGGTEENIKQKMMPLCENVEIAKKSKIISF